MSSDEYLPTFGRSVMPPFSGSASPNKDSSEITGTGIILGLIQEQDDIHLNSTAPQIVYV